ncbi:intradiol ring-cleavage dioxygenase [Robertkochia solimangrovi]|uniref:dioxygenase family protein n=1 Tax=Robertkochia solimangrovi TaxID=2213046 RepID=UPI00117F93BE|nr:intradiol ring-cleavage dioxygenase [Robertkochia solimangrovi]TRZ43179.1 intradiol ring-cleavage dioxygenase [Robertkochia solimangrovi]
MNRKHFLRKGLVGMGAIVAIPTVITACSKDEDSELTEGSDSSDSGVIGDCELSPSETAGPFPIKTPAELARENIIADRTGVALLINLTIQDQSDDCNPLAGVLVDVWHCDADGNYSQYGGTQMQRTDYSDKDFLRGRQTTDSNGQVSFISIFPGWYQGRAPHIHLEILDSSEKSIRVTQIAFPKEVCDTVYASDGYNGEADTQNETDNVFSDSLNGNMLDDITGNTTDGYTLTKTIVV